MSFPLTRLTLACLTGLSLSTHASELRLDDSVVTARGYVSDSFATPQAISVIKPQATSQGPVGSPIRTQCDQLENTTLQIRESIKPATPVAPSFCKNEWISRILMEDELVVFPIFQNCES